MKLFFMTLALIPILAGATNTASAGDQIQIVGSSTVFPFAALVAEEFHNKGQFKAPVVESTGTGGGFKLFCSGPSEDAPDIANASRKIKESEIDACKKSGVKNVAEIAIGYDGIVFANAKTAAEIKLSPEQIFRALAKSLPVNGKLQPNPNKKWSDIDPSLPSSVIRVYGPPPTSGTRDAFVELVLDKGCEKIAEIKALSNDQKKAACQTIREDGAFVEAGENDNLIIQKLTSDNTAMGIFGFSFLAENAGEVQGAIINGISPTYDTVADLSYPAARLLYVYVKLDNKQQVPGLAEFIEEFISDRASGEDGYLIDKGFIPVRGELRAKMKEMSNAPIY